MLAEKLSPVTKKIISQNQRGFVKSRLIFDCICIASEFVNLLNRKAFGGQLTLEIDTKDF